MELIAQFAKSRNVAVVAPAGCGKTYLIALAVSGNSTGRELILTHTHAGVFALCERLRQLGADPSTYVVDTIAGWSLKYSAAYPAISGLGNFMPRVRDEWESVYRSASQILDNRVIKHVVSSSYSGVYVDEYQDCLKLQHEIILKLGDLLPCRIVGDPMQSIFGFGQNQLADWDSEVMKAFNKIGELDVPWRWAKTNPELGQWLADVRRKLVTGESIELGKLPNSIQWIPSSDIVAQRRRHWMIAGKKKETSCIIHQLEPQCHNFARHTGGMFNSMETVECKDLADWALAFEESRGVKRAESVRDFAAECCTAVKTALKDLEGLLSGKKKTRDSYLREVVASLGAVAGDDSLSVVLPTLEIIRKMDGVKLFRSELYYEMCRTLKEYSTGEYSTLGDAAWDVRERTRQYGRSIVPRTVSRTLLVKGLEFDNCMVIGADNFDRNNLYVALTRGSRTLTIVSKEPKLSPK